MEVTGEKNNGNQKSLSMQASETPMNFLQGLFSGKPDKAKSSTNSEVVDLSLNLSLGGPYGQNGEEKSLTRSSSVAGDITQSTVTNESLGGYSGVRLEKSCSLPAKAERVLMRSGDQQRMRRAETRKRLLLEKQRRAAAKAAEKEKVPVAPPTPTVDVSHQAPACAYKSPALTHAMDRIKSANSNNEGLTGLAESGDSSIVRTSTKQAIRVPPISAVKEKIPMPAGTTSENASKKVRFSNPNSVQGDSMEILNKMPSVRTTGDGPNGRRIEGILYKYVKDQVWIVCVCHGRFFSPAGFVKHAGGTDVENALRRITICPGSV